MLGDRRLVEVLTQVIKLPGQTADEVLALCDERRADPYTSPAPAAIIERLTTASTNRGGAWSRLANQSAAPRTISASRIAKKMIE